MGVLEKYVEVLDKQADAIFELAEAIDQYTKRAFPQPPAPSPPAQIVPLNERHLIFGEIRMDIEQFALTYPEHPTADVVGRIVTLTIVPGATLPVDVPALQVRHLAGRAAGTTDQDLTAGRDISTAGAFEVPQDAAFSVSTVSVDDKDNQSAAVVQEFTAEDHTAPEAVGGASVAPLGERTVADPV